MSSVGLSGGKKVITFNRDQLILYLSIKSDGERKFLCGRVSCLPARIPTLEVVVVTVEIRRWIVLDLIKKK